MLYNLHLLRVIAALGVVFFHNAGYSTACGHGTIALVTWALARTAIRDLETVAFALVAAVLIGWLRLNSSWVLAGAAVLGLLLLRAG